MSLTYSARDQDAQRTLDGVLRSRLRRDGVDPQRQPEAVRRLAESVVREHDDRSLTGSVAASAREAETWLPRTTVDPNFRVAEVWALAVEDDPDLFTYVVMALDLRGQHDCKAEDWHALVDLLVDAGLPVDVYDAAVDVLHQTAAMPCRCRDCLAHDREADAMLTQHDRLLPMTDGTRVHPRSVALVAAKYDQGGRYRISNHR